MTVSVPTAGLLAAGVQVSARCVWVVVGGRTSVRVTGMGGTLSGIVSGVAAV